MKRMEVIIAFCILLMGFMLVWLKLLDDRVTRLENDIQSLERNWKEIAENQSNVIHNQQLLMKKQNRIIDDLEMIVRDLEGRDEDGVGVDIAEETKMEAIERIVKRECERYDIEPSVIMAMIEVESNFDSQAVGVADDTGLMQIIPDTARWVARELKYGSYDMKNPEDNLIFGIFYFAGCMLEAGYNVDSAGDTLPLALGIYNRGPKATAYYKENNNFINDYHEKVMNLVSKYK